MNKRVFYTFFAILFILLSVVVIQQKWHHFPIENQIFAYSLEEYDNIVFDKNACFTTLIDTQKVEYVRTNFVVRLNKQILYSEEVILPEKNNFNFCIPNTLLSEGDNFVESELYFKTVFFNIEKIDSLTYENLISQEEELKIIGVEKINDYKARINFIFNTNQTTQKKTDFYLNDEKIMSLFLSNGSHSEIIQINEGDNLIKIKHVDIEDSFVFENNISWKSNLIIGLILFSLLFFSLFVFVFGKNDWYEKIVYTILSIFSILMVLFFLLNSIGQLSSLIFLSIILFISILLIYFFKENYSLPKLKINKLSSFEIFLIIILLSTLLFNIITPTNVSFWTSFYERQSESIFYSSNIPFFDEFTHFGEKPFGYMSGYFLIHSGLATIFGFTGETIFAILMFFSNIAIILSSLIFFKKLGMDKEQSLLTVMLMLLGGFILGDIFFNIRHVISLTFAFVSMSFFIDKKIIPAIIIAGFAIFIQTPVIIFISIVSLVLNKENFFDFLKTKKFTKLIYYLKYVFTSLLVGLTFFIPVFITHGPLTQAKAATWGYLFGMPFYGVIVDLLAQLIFFFLIMLPIVNFKPKIDSISKRAAIFLVILIFIQLFISYRVNVATIIIFSFLAVYWFPKDLLKKPEVKHLLFIIFIFGLFISVNVLLNYVVPDYAIHPVEYIKFNTSTDSKFLVEPALGHYTAYFAQRKISTDLAVEYANQELIDDSFLFLTEKNPDIIIKHKIDYVFNRAKYIETQPVGSKELDKPIEFYFMNKIYDNGVFYIHKTR
jgi:hypothetical protein